ncbi:AAA family ATPase, partial [Streptomyces sp. NPDC051940]|uniref:AAA family ATPase n=1 Tax=Streptomyces sp. NPDC051940 TaxID=3155675 RepID=UPI0034334928
MGYAARHPAGRQAELEAVDGFLVTAGRQPAGLVLTGEPGIGKTTLWATAVDEARRRGHRVLAARPAAAEAGLSYALLADLLSGVDEAVLRPLPRPQRAAVESVLLRAEPDEDGLDPRAIGWALLSLAGRLAHAAPLLLAVDDLQWADPSSAAALAFAARRVHGRVGVLAAVRTGAAGVPLPEVGEGTRILTLGPLATSALHRVLRDRLGRALPRPALDRIERVSGGNPLYALELARAAGDTGSLPDSLTQLMAARVERIPAPVREVLLAASALAEPTAGRIAQALGGNPDPLLEAAEEQGVISITGTRVRFTHPLLSTAVHDAAGPSARRAMHRRLAATAEDIEERARHLALAAIRADAETVAALDAAAAGARTRG